MGGPNCCLLNCIKNGKPQETPILFFSKKTFAYYQRLVFTGEITDCLTSLGEPMPCRKHGILFQVLFLSALNC